MPHASLTLHRYRLDGPSLPGARREGVLMCLKAPDGREGWGDAAPLPGFSSETIDEAEAALRTAVGWADHLWQDIESAFDAISRAVPVDAPSARFGLETAALNLQAAATGREAADVLADWFGLEADSGPVRSAALVTAEPEAWPTAVERLALAGFGTVKLKLGRDDAATERRGLARLARCGHRVRYRLDPNRSWTVEEAAEAWEAAAGLDIEFVEEPLREPDGLQTLVDRTGMPVALDESLRERSPAEAPRCVAALVVKPTLMGGFSAVRAWVDALPNLPVVVSSSYESGVGLCALADLARALGSAAAGLDTARALPHDLIEPRISVSEGLVRRPRKYVVHPGRGTP